MKITNFLLEIDKHGDDVEFLKTFVKKEEFNILHGHYTPMKVIEDNKDKIHSNVLHNSVNHIIKSQMGDDSSFV